MVRSSSQSHPVRVTSYKDVWFRSSSQSHPVRVTLYKDIWFRSSSQSHPVRVALYKDISFRSSSQSHPVRVTLYKDIWFQNVPFYPDQKFWYGRIFPREYKLDLNFFPHRSLDKFMNILTRMLTDIKVSENVISSELPCKDGNLGFTTVPHNLRLMNIMEDIVVFF